MSRFFKRSFLAQFLNFLVTLLTHFCIKILLYCFFKINVVFSGLAESPVFYTDSAPSECYSNETQPVEIFVLLAKRIHTANNQTVNETDMVS